MSRPKVPLISSQYTMIAVKTIKVIVFLLCNQAFHENSSISATGT
jgi:hypothetical protein